MKVARVLIPLVALVMLAGFTTGCSEGPPAQADGQFVGYYQGHSIILHDFPQPSDNCALAATATAAGVVTSVGGAGPLGIVGWTLTLWGATGLEDACGGSWPQVQAVLDFRNAIKDCIWGAVHSNQLEDCLVSGWVAEGFIRIAGDQGGTWCYTGTVGIDAQMWFKPFGHWHGLAGMVC